ncbi:MAG: amino acid ABC transporter permease [Thermodesulfobacteriota bacterium]
MFTYYLNNLIAALPFFLKGLWMTVVVSGVGLVCATILGFLTGLARNSRWRALRFLIALYVDVMRGTPFLVQVFFIFFILPEMGVHLDPLPAAFLAMTIMGGAFICEIVAAGLAAVPHGQLEAALSTGLNRFQQMRYVILPQSMRTILPPLVGQYVLLVKDSSIVSVIGVTDLTRVGWLIVQRIPEGLMVFGLVGIFYFVVCYPLIRLSNLLEKRMTVQATKL